MGGKKNFLPPSQLTLGFGFMFKLGDDESVARHINDRRVRFEQDEDETPKTQEELEEISEHDVESLGDEIESINVLDHEEKEIEVDADSKIPENKSSDEMEKDDSYIENQINDGDNELKNDESNSDSDKNNPDVPQFPDTELEIKYSLGKQGKVVELKTTSTSQGIEAAKFVNATSSETDKSKKVIKEAGRGQPQWKIDQQNSTKEDNRQKRGKKGKLK